MITTTTRFLNIEEARKKFPHAIIDDIIVHEDVHIGENVIIRKYARINVNAFISNNVSIKERVSIGANTYIGEGVSISNDVYISESVCIEENTKIGSNVYIDAKTHIRQNVEIGKRAYIGAKVRINTGAFIHDGARISDGASIRKDAIIKKGGEGLVLHGSYKYPASVYFDSRTEEIIIRLGCYHRTIKEWESDFDNNIKEFPRGSREREARWKTFQFLKKWKPCFQS